MPVALIVDDVHEIPAGSAGAAFLDELIAALPANGHVVLAGRTDPPVRLARLLASGEAIAVREADLRLRPDELTDLAHLRGLDADALLGSGGWPALASLSASAGHGVAERYVWEEVLAQLAPCDQRALAALALLDGGDRAVDRICTRGRVRRRQRWRGCRSSSVATTAACDRMPCGRPALAGVLDEAEAAEVRRRAAATLRERGDLARAAELLLPASDDRDWLELSQVIVAGASSRSG